LAGNQDALAGNQDAREWMLDLKEIALAMQAEQNQTSALLQALHGFVMRQADCSAAARIKPLGRLATTAATPIGRVLRATAGQRSRRYVRQFHEFRPGGGGRRGIRDWRHGHQPAFWRRGGVLTDCLSLAHERERPVRAGWTA
jgi:hypothetical protein